MYVGYRRWTPHPSAISTQRFPFCGFILMNQLTARGEPCLRAWGCCVMCCASQSEAIKAGGVMVGLMRAGGGSHKGRWSDGGSHPWHHLQDSALGSSSSVLTPVCWHFRSYKIHKHNTKAVISTAQCHLISVLFRRQKRFFPTNAAIIFPCRSCSTTKDLQQIHRNQESEKCCNSPVWNYNT